MTKFYKVSKKLYINDYIKIFGNFHSALIENIYDSIVLPKRATKGSAGYDFFSPISFSLEPHNEILIPTGIRVEMNLNQVLLMFPRSSLGFKYKLRLNNTIGVIDSDYFYSDNEGHIFVKISNENDTTNLFIEKQTAFCQGLFIKYDLTDDDDVAKTRNGGLGSTNEKKD